jgi:arylsulfatase A-like enzyme
MQGRSLVPLIDGGQPADWRTQFFYEEHTFPRLIPPSERMRTERWAYIRWVNEKPVREELYDVQADPLEAHNLAQDPQFAEQLAQLQAEWAMYAKSLR